MLAPDEKFYYFKRSQFKPSTQTRLEKDFKFEFWNEIIAYEIGNLLGFKVLQYNIAIDENIMGCISESMINPENQELIEGVKYLQAYSPEFDPSNTKHRAWYTFDLIDNALRSARMGGFLIDLLELIILDALIGNGDRHQENWAIISTKLPLSDILNEEGKYQNGIFKKMIQALKWLENKLKARREALPQSYYEIDYTFAPIYDSGSSLGRELLTEKVELLLSSEEELKTYVLKGTSEIHWENKKVSHFQLIRNLLDSPHRENLKNIIARVIQKFNGPKIEQLIEAVDQEVPETHAGYRIPSSRKRLIYKIITLRFETLRELINERV